MYVCMYVQLGTFERVLLEDSTCLKNDDLSLCVRRKAPCASVCIVSWFEQNTMPVTAGWVVGIEWEWNSFQFQLREICMYMKLMIIWEGRFLNSLNIVFCSLWNIQSLFIVCSNFKKLHDWFFSINNDCLLSKQNQETLNRSVAYIQVQFFSKL